MRDHYFVYYYYLLLLTVSLYLEAQSVDSLKWQKWEAVYLDLFRMPEAILFNL
jgi:hypothetical protein